MADRKAVIKNADMAEDMQQDAIDCATQALEKYNIEKDIAAFIKKDDVEGHPRDQALHLLLPGSGGDLGLQVRLSQDPPRSRFLKNGMSAAQRVKYFYEEQVQRMECLNYETIAFHDVLCQLHDMIGPRVTGEFRLADFKRKRKFAGSFFSIFTSLNKFMAFENRDPFQAKQELCISATCGFSPKCRWGSWGMISSDSPAICRDRRSRWRTPTALHGTDGVPTNT
eukprot:g33750.t1